MCINLACSCWVGWEQVWNFYDLSRTTWGLTIDDKWVEWFYCCQMIQSTVTFYQLFASTINSTFATDEATRCVYVFYECFTSFFRINTNHCVIICFLLNLIHHCNKPHRFYIGRQMLESYSHSYDCLRSILMCNSLTKMVYCLLKMHYLKLTRVESYPAFHPSK